MEITSGLVPFTSRAVPAFDAQFSRRDCIPIWECRWDYERSHGIHRDSHGTPHDCEPVMVRQECGGAADRDPVDHIVIEPTSQPEDFETEHFDISQEPEEIPTDNNDQLKDSQPEYIKIVKKPIVPTDDDDETEDFEIAQQPWEILAGIDPDFDCCSAFPQTCAYYADRSKDGVPRPKYLTECQRRSALATQNRWWRAPKFSPMDLVAFYLPFMARFSQSRA